MISLQGCNFQMGGLAYNTSFFSPSLSNSQIYLFIYLKSLCFYLIKNNILFLYKMGSK